MTIENHIEQLEQKISEAQQELAYYKALQFMHNLEATAEAVLAHYLVPHYGAEKVRVFSTGTFTGFLASHYKMSVKTGISRYKSMADTKKDPSWARKAREYAQVVDAWRNKED